MATSGDMIVKINSAEILKLEKDGEGIIFDSKAEDAIVRLLEMQRELDSVVKNERLARCYCSDRLLKLGKKSVFVGLPHSGPLLFV